MQFEAGLVQEVFYTDQEAGLQRVIPVVLPGGSADDLPLWLAPVSTSCYRVREYTLAGADKLLRLLTDQPFETEPPLGKVPVLLPRGAGQPTVAASPVLRTEVVIEAALSEQGELASAVWVAGSLLSQRKAPLPAEIGSVWEARLPAAVGGQRLAEAGRKLAGTILDADGQGVLAEVIGRKRPGDTVEVALVAGGDALSLPVELIRLATGSGDIGPLGLMPGVSVVRRLATPGQAPGDTPPQAVDRPAGTAAPLKVLAAVAAPDETKTRSAPWMPRPRCRRYWMPSPGSATSTPRYGFSRSHHCPRSAAPSNRTPSTCCTCPRTAHPRWSNSKTKTVPPRR